MKSVKQYLPFITFLVFLITLLVFSFIYSFMTGVLTILLIALCISNVIGIGRNLQLKDINDKLVAQLKVTNDMLGRIAVTEKIVWEFAKKGIKIEPGNDEDNKSEEEDSNE